MDLLLLAALALAASWSGLPMRARHSFNSVREWP